MRLRSTRIAALGALTIAIAGCGGDHGTTVRTIAVTGPPALDRALAARVPADVRATGRLRIATDPSYPPNELLAADGRTIVGLDPDLGTALGRVLGLDVRFVAVPFDAIMPRVRERRYEAGMSSLIVTGGRRADLDFVTYLTAGSAFLVAARGGPAVTSLADLCGRRVGVSRGTTQKIDGRAQQKRCAIDGKRKLRLFLLPDVGRLAAAVASGRVEVAILDSPLAADAVRRSGGRLRLVGSPYGTAAYGIALAPRSPLAPVLRDAMTRLVDDGHYRAILQAWGLEGGAIDAPTVEPAAG